MAKLRFKIMPARYCEEMPEFVKSAILDIISIRDCDSWGDYELIMRPIEGETEVTGMDFDRYGNRGAHFHFSESDARAFRKFTAKRRIAWDSLSFDVKRAIENYCLWHAGMIAGEKAMAEYRAKKRAELMA